MEDSEHCLPIRWGRADLLERGPVIGSTSNCSQRNVIGTHSGSYGVYRALAVAGRRADAWPPSRPHQHGADGFDRSLPGVGRSRRRSSRSTLLRRRRRGRKDEIAKGYDVRPTIAVTKAHIDLLEVHCAIAAGRLVPDGRILLANGSAVVTKAAIEPVWWLPGWRAASAAALRPAARAVRGDGGMYPESVTRRPR
ncbi:MAG: hypothetical protein U1F41_10125 [Burkholderiales bacterium]